MLILNNKMVQSRVWSLSIWVTVFMRVKQLPRPIQPGHPSV